MMWRADGSILIQVYPITYFSHHPESKLNPPVFKMNPAAAAAPVNTNVMVSRKEAARSTAVTKLGTNAMLNLQEVCGLGFDRKDATKLISNGKNTSSIAASAVRSGVSAETVIGVLANNNYCATMRGINRERARQDRVYNLGIDQ